MAVIVTAALVDVVMSAVVIAVAVSIYADRAPPPYGVGVVVAAVRMMITH